MENNMKKFTLPRQALPIVTVVLSVALILVVLHLSKDKTPSGFAAILHSEVKELLVQNVTEENDTVLVETTYGTVRYPYAFSDILSVESENRGDHAVLEFNAAIDGETHKLYTLYFNSEEGMPVGILRIDNKTYVVSAEFHDANGISDLNMATFYAAQETFNDVVNSLSENENFKAGD